MAVSQPVLVGGIALRAYDLPASSVFAAVYGLVLPLYVYRCVPRRSRTTILYTVICFAIERVILYSLRAAAAANPGFESFGLSQYMQLTFALGFLTLANVLSVLIRSALVSTTNPPPESEEKAKAAAAAESKAVSSTPNQPPLVATAARWKLGSSPVISAGSEAEDVRRRQFFRACSHGMGALYLVAVVFATVGLDLYPTTNTSPKLTASGRSLRYASDAVGLALLLWEAGILLWASRNVPRMDQRALRLLLSATMLLMLPAIYRLAVMLQTTSDLAAPTHAALNTQGDKAAFYILHALPEWLVALLLCAFNIKEVCSMGFKGDFRWRDETPAEREKRWAKERERARKKALKKMKKAGDTLTPVGFEMTAKDITKGEADSAMTLA